MIGQSKTRLLGVTVLVAMFAAGGLTGAVLQRSATADKPPSRPPQRGPNLFETLQLTDAQQAQVCVIVARKAEEMRPHRLAFDSAWNEHGPAMKAIVESTNSAVDSVLTPEQLAKKESFRTEREKYFRDRQTKSKQQPPQGAKPGDNGPRREGDRGGRPGGNPLGVKCPGLDDVSHAGMPPRPR